MAVNQVVSTLATAGAHGPGWNSWVACVWLEQPCWVSLDELSFVRRLEFGMLVLKSIMSEAAHAPPSIVAARADETKARKMRWPEEGVPAYFGASREGRWNIFHLNSRRGFT